MSGRSFLHLFDSADHSWNPISSSNKLPISGTVELGATDNAVLDSIDASLSGTLTVDGSGVTQPVSGTVTANLSATDNSVLDSIDASLSGTLTVDGSGVTQPVSGTVTANAGTNLNTSALALESGGNLASLAGCVSGSEFQCDIVSGSITANAGTNLNTSALALESGGNLASLAGCVSGSKFQCEVIENVSAEQTLSIATIASQDSNSYDTTNYKSFSVIVESDTVDQQVQLQWSHDNTNFYQLTPYNTTNSVNDEQGANPQHIYSVYGDVLAKYFKVAVYNPGLSTASTKVIVYLVK